MIKRSMLSKKLLVGVLTISSIATAVFTLVNLSNDYLSEMDAVNDSLAGVRKSSQPSISAALFQYDEEAVTSQVEGIFTLPFISKISIIEEGSDTPFVERSKDSFVRDELSGLSIVRFFPSLAKHTTTVVIPLFMTEEDETEDVGVLNLTITKQFIYDRLFQKTIIFAILQAIKTFITSFALLLFFNMVVSKRLTKLTDKLHSVEVNSLSEKDKNLGIKLSKSRDEIDKLIIKSQEFIGTIINFKTALEESLDQHKEKALSSSRMATIGEMSAGIAHEINNPLAVISGCSEILQTVLFKQGYDANEALLNRNHSSIERAISRIKGITYGLLKYSSKGDQLRLVPIDLKGTIQEILELCHLRASSENVTIKTDLDSVEDSIVEADDVLLGQVLMNLINNAIDAFKEGEKTGREISIKLENTDKNTLLISVKNNGPTIPEEIRDKIMDPFFTTKDVGKGTGLGLSISHGIIQSFKGKFGLSPDKVTCFTIELPVLSSSPDTNSLDEAK